MKQYVKCMPNPGKNTPCYGCIFPHTHSWGDPYSCEWEEVYTGNRVYFLQTQPAYSESQMTTKYSSWDLTQDGHQKLSMGYLNQDAHQPKALHGSSSEKAISNSSQMATKKKKKTLHMELHSRWFAKALPGTSLGLQRLERDFKNM